MKLHHLIARGLIYYWRTNSAVVLGVATAVAVLSGALLVGDSVRGSLRDLVLQRIGRTDRIVMSPGLFREALADELRTDDRFAASFDAVCPIFVMRGLVSNQASGRRASRVQVYGIDDRFWRFHGISMQGPSGREALINRTLAKDLGASAGSTVLVRVERPSAIPLETLHGRKDNVGRTVRLAVRAILPPEAFGDFSLQPQQGDVRVVFVSLRRLQQDLDAAGRVNTLLVANRQHSASLSADALQTLIRDRFQLEDVGLTVRAISSGAIAIESAAGLLDDPRATAVDRAAAANGVKTQPILTYLANSMRSGARQVPYSLVTATDLRTIGSAAALARDSSPPPIVLNDWTARDLKVRVGDPLTLDYYVWEDPGRLLSRTADFRVAAIVPLAGAAADRDFAPVYPGITEAAALADWDPPFPIDLGRVRPIDEDYWHRYRTTPKAFVSFEVGQRLWRSRFGDRTSVRITPAPGESPAGARDSYALQLREAIDPLSVGLTVRDVRADGLAASRGATDFGAYFTYFSVFLVLSALLLAALFFRLSVEQRGREIGLLRSLGFTAARVRRVFSTEGFVLAAIGTLLGSVAAVGYGGLMITGLRSWWSGAVGTTALRLHVSPTSLIVGGTATLTLAVICIWWTLGSLSRVTERGLLAGRIEPDTPAPNNSPQHRSLAPLASLAFALVAAILLIASASGALDRTAAFFGAGTSLLVASLCSIAYALGRPPRSSTDTRGQHVWWLGVRNAAVRPGRSVLAIGVIASATFILIAVGAFRRDSPAATDRHSGVGGYSLLVDLLLPVVNDPNGRDGREALGLSGIDGITIEPLRVLPGDDASCLNLYEPRNPRILGVRRPFIEAGRFAFQGSVAVTEAERVNPWLLLTRDLGDAVVPVIADANSMTYVLHKQLGEDIVIEHGDRPIRLRIVAALADSIFQSALLMAEVNFVKLFREQEGYRLLLVETTDMLAPRVARAIEEGAGDLGADAIATTEWLAGFHRVENTYLSTFQMLGGFGLLVGTIGLAAVLLRNVLERRRELALLAAVGYRRSHIFTIIIAENLLLLIWGLAIGTVCAVIAIAPAFLERGGRMPVTPSSAILLVAVFITGLLSSLVATKAALRTPLLSALRSE
jgi:putative ABC transport system permease protein